MTQIQRVHSVSLLVQYYLGHPLRHPVTVMSLSAIREPIVSFTGHKALLALLVSSKNSGNRQTKHFEDILWCFWKCKMQNSRVFDDIL